ncbi:hypothetical protein FRACA_210009 [Frankia canadensis]|uniref:Uncharacterized protein n=1 Tax=Frankia canadensis TaxID=1836972 RepID=A0A2I2KQI1_9ACTN|nr:hypothetical protein FRACA_210009 [Frankia canadensis]SOU55214.1 hypothetical protein FRACA_210009 [Frankia canadensis]
MSSAAAMVSASIMISDRAMIPAGTVLSDRAVIPACAGRLVAPPLASTVVSAGTPRAVAVRAGALVIPRRRACPEEVRCGRAAVAGSVREAGTAPPAIGLMRSGPADHVGHPHPTSGAGQIVVDTLARHGHGHGRAPSRRSPPPWWTVRCGVSIQPA